MFFYLTCENFDDLLNGEILIISVEKRSSFFHLKSQIKKVETTLFYSISSYEIHRITYNNDELLVKRGLISLGVKSRAPYCGVLSH